LESIKDLLLNTPESQLDPKIKILISSWDIDPKSFQILEVLDKCIYYGAASDFVIRLLQALYDRALCVEKVSHEYNVLFAEWRKDVEKHPRCPECGSEYEHTLNCKNKN
jgi:hypothetical protein